ncbi:MAG: cobaltochelatase subunit CobN [Alphaproteobacteria bacterium]
MHLLTDPGRGIDDGDVAVDLALPPGDIVFLSAADSELASFAHAGAARDGDAPSVRLANLMQLAHPFSVDLFADQTASSASLIVVRVLGGAGYWSYGLEVLRGLARAGGPKVAVIPGETAWNPELEAYCTIAIDDARRVWRYLVEGGPANATNCLAYLDHLIGRGPMPPDPLIIPNAGYYLPDQDMVDAPAIAASLTPSQPVAAIVFYKSVINSGSSEPVDRLIEALADEGVSTLPVFVDSLKNEKSAGFLAAAFARFKPAIVLNTTAFAISRTDAPHAGTVLDAPGRPVLQVVMAGSSRQAWLDSLCGLLPRDLTMNVVLPEIDGRLLTRPISFKERADDAPAGLTTTTHRADPERCRFVAAQAARWVSLAARPVGERNIAVLLSNYPDRDGRIANGVGLDTPESAARVLQALAAAGYGVGEPPADGARLMTRLLAGRTNASPATSDVRFGLDAYMRFFADLPESVRDAVLQRWGPAAADPGVVGSAFHLGVQRFERVVVAIQPPRGYGVDPKASYHDPDLIPPHGYLAFYGWLREAFGADAVVHLGKHGNLEWLPGKATGLSATCWPEVALGPVPLVYPFIVNDPGEGSQAKRRSSAVIIDHLMPAMTRAEIHGPLARLETLVDEYYVADGVDPKRRDYLAEQIIAVAREERLDADLGIASERIGGSLQAIDAHLCDLKEMQIRDGLHVFGTSPQRRLRRDTLVAVSRVPRSGTGPEAASLHRAIAADFGLDVDPLTCEATTPWHGPMPAPLACLVEAPWRTAGDAVERIELFAAALLDGAVDTTTMPATTAVRDWIEEHLAPALDRSGADEMAHLLRALDGRFVPPGPSGAPTRGRADVLPSGRNFYSVDVRGVPTEAAWALGRKSADALALRYFHDEGIWPRSIAMSAWATSNMRTGGEDIAHALALMGARPVWEPGTGRVTGVSVTPLSELGRPRVDVTLRISGMFRDAFPGQIDLIDTAVAAIADLEEDAEANPLAATVRAQATDLRNDGVDAAMARKLAMSRIYGAKPGAYGAGLQALIDHGGWETRDDFARAFLAWGGFAYGAGREGAEAGDLLAARLGAANAVYQAQDNREHDILDSDDYYQFQGGLAATVEALSGAAPPVYHGDTSRPDNPKIRSLGEEIARVVRGRATNPKWLAGVMRHGYKGAFEIAATVDYLFAFAATTEAVGDHHFDQLFNAFLVDDEVRTFIAENNPAALGEMAARFREAIDRQLWAPRSNSAYDRLSTWIGEFTEASI